VNTSIQHLSRTVIVGLLCVATVWIVACHRTKTSGNAKRYPFTGRIVSVDAKSDSASIDGDLVQGFMEPMVMTYKFKPGSMLRQVAPGDSISAEVVVIEPDPNDRDAAPDYWLENVKVTGHAKSPPTQGPSSMHIPQPGEEVPDFSLTNQDGKRVSLKQYRGKVLMVTFIYTRCPFQDFCPRMSRNFDEIYKQLGEDRSTHLLSVSFDPEHDTPKELRKYGYSVAHTKDAGLFKRWEFAVPRAPDLPKIAQFFALTVTPEGGLITHNLSTAVIGPEGKIVSWYHGGDWQVSDLMKDAAGARVPKA
jgi:protein SCO1/2